MAVCGSAPQVAWPVGTTDTSPGHHPRSWRMLPSPRCWSMRQGSCGSAGQQDHGAAVEAQHWSRWIWRPSRARWEPPAKGEPGWRAAQWSGGTEGHPRISHWLRSPLRSPRSSALYSRIVMGVSGCWVGIWAYGGCLRTGSTFVRCRFRRLLSLRSRAYGWKAGSRMHCDAPMAPAGGSTGRRWSVTATRRRVPVGGDGTRPIRARKARRRCIVMRAVVCGGEAHRVCGDGKMGDSRPPRAATRKPTRYR